MSSFLQGVSLGSQIVQSGVDQYWKQKQWQERLAERKEDKATAATTAHYQRNKDAAAASRQTYEDYQKESRDDRDFKLKEKVETDKADYQTKHLDAEKAHWRAMEGKGSGRSGATHDLTQNQAITALGKFKAPPATQREYEDRKKLHSIAYPGQPYDKFEAPKPSWGKRLLGALTGGSDTPASGSGLVGLE